MPSSLAVAAADTKALRVACTVLKQLLAPNENMSQNKSPIARSPESNQKKVILRDLNRRKFLTRASAAWVGAILSVLPWRAATANPPPVDPVVDVLTRFVPANRMTRRITAVMDARGETARAVAALERRIYGFLPPDCAVSPTDIRQQLSDWIKADFGHGRTVSVDGWRLARTEADLICLVSKYRMR